MNPDMQNKGKIELSVVLGFIHINGGAVLYGGRYLEPRDLTEDTKIVIDLETGKTES